jgi:outer membrane protein assembly factor BamB
LGILAAACVAALPLRHEATAADWPRWRGPKGDGISEERDWSPAQLLPAPKVLWKTNVGAGYSACTTSGTFLFTMGNDGKQDTVWCLDAATGAEVWRFSYDCGAGSYAGPRAAPVVDGGLLYTLSREGHLFCLDARSGAVKWQKNLQSDFKANNIGWGFSGSPCVDGRLLLINAGVRGVALDKATGAVVWSTAPGAGGYATPVPYTAAGGRRCAVVFGQKKVYGVDLKDGAELWSHPWETAHDVNAADPIVLGNKVFISSGYNKGCALLAVGTGAGVRVEWQSAVVRSHFSSPVLLDGYLYGIDGNAGKGDLVCIEFRTGTEKWRHNSGFGSLVAADGKLIVLNEAGDLLVARATPAAFEGLASAKGVLGRTCWTMPVLGGGRLYLRNDKGDLVCLDLGKPRP